jgi:hypothetical protein
MSPVQSSRSTIYRKKRESLDSREEASRSRVSRLEKGKAKSPENQDLQVISNQAYMEERSRPNTRGEQRPVEQP